MPHSYDVNGPRYLGVAAFKPEEVSQISKDIVKPGEPAKSTMHIPVSYSSRSYGRTSPTRIGDFDFMKSGGGRLEAFHVSDTEKYGLATHWEERGDRFQSWIDAGVKNQSREEVVYPQKSINYGLIESFGERQLKVDEGSTPVNVFVHDFSYNGPINDFGKVSHRAKNIKQHLMEYYGLKSTPELVSFLKSHGLTLGEIEYLAILSIPGIYGVNETPDGKVIFIASEDSNDSIVNDARAYDVPSKLYRIRGIDEEQIHIARKTKIGNLAELLAEEIATKTMLRDFYAKMAKDSEGNPELVRQYKKFVEVMENDLKTTPRRYIVAYRQRQRDLEDIVEDADKSETSEGRYYKTSADGKVVYMQRSERSRSANAKGGKERKEKGKVIYARDRFRKDYKGRNAEADSKYSREDSDARSDEGKENPKESEAKGEPAEDAEAAAEAA